MTMDRVYHPHGPQHGFQQQPADQGVTEPHTHHHNQLHHVQQQVMQSQSSSSPPPPPPPPPHTSATTTMIMSHRQGHSDPIFPMQQSRHPQSNPYHRHHSNNYHKHPHSQEQENRLSHHGQPLLRPVHPPPPPPPSHQLQSMFVHQQPQSDLPIQNYPTFMPPLMVPSQTNPELKPPSSEGVTRNSLPINSDQVVDHSSEMAHRNSLQNNYYANTHFQYYQPSNLKRHPTHHNKYINDQQQLLQPNHLENQHGNVGVADPLPDLQQSDNAVFGVVCQASPDPYADKVSEAILRAQHALEKPIEERNEHDVLLIDNLCSLVHGFDSFPKSVRRALAAQTVLIVIDEMGKELIVHNEELDSFCVLIWGECQQLNETKTETIRYYNIGDAFGVCEPTTETIRFEGHMVTEKENNAFLCVKRDDFYTILTDPANYPSKELIRHRDHNGSIVCVSRFSIGKRSSGPLWSYHMQSKPSKIVLPNGHVITKATEACLLTALVDGYERLDPEYVEDFLLLFRVFMTWDQKDKEKQLPPGMIKLCLSLAKWLDSPEYRDRVVKVVLTWLSSYYHDFELNPEFSYLYFRLLESRLLNLSMNNQLHLLHVTLTTKSKIRHVTISRSSREQPLAFAIAGGYEKNCGIFVTQVNGLNSDDSPHDSLMNYLNYPVQGSQDRINVGPTVPPRSKSLSYNLAFNHVDINHTKISSQLKPGDQILEVNGTNFSAIKLVEAQKRLDMATHLSLTVRYSPSAFHEMRALPEGRRKSSMSSLSSVSPYPQPNQKFTFNLHEQLAIKNGSEQYSPSSPTHSNNANFGFKSIAKSAPKNDRSRLSNLISSSRQLVKHIRDSTAQSNLAETASRGSGDHISEDQQNFDQDLGKLKSNPDLPVLRGKDKVDYGLSNVVRPVDEPGSAAMFDAPSQTAVSVLRVFNAANNDSRYLLVHEEMTAREVIMVAVKEFNLTGNNNNNGANSSPGDRTISSLNWHLYEVSVVPESRTIKQKCLSEQTSRLAERSSLCSRLYIKNNSQGSIGPTKLDMGDDALVNEILKECPANVTLTSLNATLLAVELTLADFDKFRSIEPQQFVYDTFFDCSDKQKSAINTNGSISSHDSASLKSSSSESQDSSDILSMMNKTRSVPACWTQDYRQFADISNREMFWVICEILNERNIGRRAKIIKQFVHVADICSQLRNYNSMFAIISGLGHSCVTRLRRTFDKLKPKYKNHLDEMRKLFDPSKNMAKYRARLSSAQPPTIPLFPQIKKDLTFTKEGRSIFLREPNDLSDDDDTGFSQDTIRRKTREDMLSVDPTTMTPVNGLERAHNFPIAQRRSISYNHFTNSQKAPGADDDNYLINFAEIRQFAERVRNVIHFSSVPYPNDLLTSTKDNQRNQAQIKKMHEEWQMRKRIRHYISETLVNAKIELPQPYPSDRASSSTGSSGDKLDQIDGPALANKSNCGKIIISYDERTLYQKSLELEPEMNARPQVASEPRHLGTTIDTNAAAVQSIQLHLPPPVAQMASSKSIQPLQPIAASSPTLSKSSSLSSCSSFNHHLPNYHAARASSNLASGVGKFGTESTESLRKLKSLSENVDDWRSSSCNTNNNNHGSGNHSNRMASDGRGSIAKNLVPSRIFPPKNGR